MITFYYKTKIPIDFWCRQGLNPKSFIQLSETLLVELTRTHNFHQYESILLYYFCNDNLARSPDWCTNRVSHLCAQCTLEAFYIRLVTVHQSAIVAFHLGGHLAHARATLLKKKYPLTLVYIHYFILISTIDTKMFIFKI